MVKRLKAKKKNGHANGNGNGQIQHATMGRPSKYRPEFAVQAAKLCKLGAIDSELADFFEVTLPTIYYWSSHYPEFFKAIKKGKEPADERVERSLYMRATGFWIDTEKVFTTKDGDVIRVPTKDYYPPDVGAICWWQKNRRPDLWRDKHEVDVSGKIEHHFTLQIFEKDLSTLKTIDAEPIKRLSGK